MTKETTIFVSHHNSDKALLARVKAWLKHYGIALFLAHDDIEVGENDIEAIRKGIIRHDAFFAYGSAKAMQSAACNQEIGMAMALEKQTIWALTPGERPWGVMPPQQGIIIKSGNEDEVAGALFYDLFMAIEKKIRPDTAKTQIDTMKEASFSAFALLHNEDKYSSNPGVITLIPYYGEWEREREPTQFCLHHAGMKLGIASVVCNGQSNGQLTDKFLPTKFPFLGQDYLSAIKFDEGCNTQLRKALSLLLNDMKDDISRAKNFKDKSALNILLQDDAGTQNKLNETDNGFGDIEDIPF